jgi:TolA-binding protein
MVGAFLDPNSPTAEYMEAGLRFYVRIEDRDLPLLSRLGKQPRVILETSHGDREQADTIPLNADGMVIGSMPTAVGVARPGDGTLQVVSGASIRSSYFDEISKDGSLNVARTGTVEVVSSGTLSFMLGDYESTAGVAYQDQPCFLLLLDADLDVSAARDTAEIQVISRYKKLSESEAVLARSANDEIVYITRDQIRVRMTELGTNAILRTGRFGGQFEVSAYRGETPSQNDALLTCEQGDESVATYADALSIGGPVERTVTVSLPVLGKMDSNLNMTQYVVFNMIDRAKKNLVEGEAYLELARIFRAMGLIKGAKEQMKHGLARSEEVIGLVQQIPQDLTHRAYKLTWELHIVGDDLASAMAVCGVFNRLYPDSPLVDEALIGMANIHRENRDYEKSIETFRQVLSLAKSEAKGEAHFRIGEALMAQGEAQVIAARRIGRPLKGGGNPMRASAIQEYKLCAERFPDSPFAPQAIGNVVDYFVDEKDYVQAGALLEQVFLDYPDAKFLDAMLLKWVLVAYQSGDFVKARDKCTQLMSEYPESPHAEKAKKILPKIEEAMRKAGGGSSEAAAGGGTEN